MRRVSLPADIFSRQGAPAPDPHHLAKNVPGHSPSPQESARRRTSSQESAASVSRDGCKSREREHCIIEPPDPRMQDKPSMYKANAVNVNKTKAPPEPHEPIAALQPPPIADGYSLAEKEFPTLASLLLNEMKSAGVLTFHAVDATQYYCEHRVKISKNKLSVILATTGESTRPDGMLCEVKL